LWCGGASSKLAHFYSKLSPSGFASKGIVDLLFNRQTWPHLTGFVKLIPDGDILPSRSKYSEETHDWQVGVNYLYGDTKNPQHALWYSLPDVVASVLLTGRIPKVLDAFRIEARGTWPGLRSVRLRGAPEIDPRAEDFFKVAIEQRKRLPSGTEDSIRLGRALKCLANSTGFGTNAEMNRQKSDERVNVLCHGIESEPFECWVAHPDVPGEYYFSPLASLTTGGARLMLALLEHTVRDLGGTYAMEDTDSMAIVATEHGGVIPCPGGNEVTDSGIPGIKALSRAEVDHIAKRFEALNPYARDAIKGSILKIEDDNFDNGDPKSGKFRQIYCYAISAKRYCLFESDADGRPVLLRAGVNNQKDRRSEHGLGHLLNPTDPEREDREWIAHIWMDIISGIEAADEPTLCFGNRPAVGRISISSPAVIRHLAALNEGKKYADQVKPFNFLLTCHVQPMGHPTGVDPEHFHLIGPYESDPRKWLKKPWIDQYSGNQYRIATEGDFGGRKTARVKTYDDVAREYAYHPESKCADAEGNICGKQTEGLLQRRHVYIASIKYISKESNSLEEVNEGLIHAEQNVYTEYPDPRRDEWQLKTLPILKRIPLAMLIDGSGLSRRALLDIRAGNSRTHAKNMKRLLKIAQTSSG
jgi:hypothetical protein